MEMEFFVEPGTDEQWHDYWLEQRWQWYVDLGLDPENMRFFEHPKENSATTPSALSTSSIDSGSLVLNGPNSKVSRTAPTSI